MMVEISFVGDLLVQDVDVLLAPFETFSLLLQLQNCIQLIEGREDAQHTDTDSVGQIKDKIEKRY